MVVVACVGQKLHEAILITSCLARVSPVGIVPICTHVVLAGVASSRSAGASAWNHR